MTDHPSAPPQSSTPSAPDVEVITLGCRLNSVESDAIKHALRAYEPADRAQPSKLIVINSCAVTAQAVRDTKQTIRKMARTHPHARIVVTGCAAQIEPQTFAAMSEVSDIIGNDRKTHAATWASLATSHERVRVNDWDSLTETASAFAPMLHVDHRDGHTRAFVEVQNGCDHRCTFCIIPFGRGPARSAPAGHVVEQIRTLVARGFHEIVLTGVDLTSWGHDLPAAPKLGALVKQILTLVPELARLRLSSLDCIEADDDLISAFAEHERLMPYLHLSLQAGDDLILKRMKRRHLRQDAIDFCATIRRLRPDMSFGADLIAGFPTETEEMFTQSLNLIDECGLSFIHVFPFSPRQGTAAAKMPPVHGSIIKERARVLREKAAEAYVRHLDQHIGKILPVLTERGGIARAADFTPIRLDHPSGHLGHVRVTHRQDNELYGAWCA